ncbi:MAG: efflux RND transporter periplasmic adaptor subunit [Patescibacteria group bacterium]|jgi:HlyD family secretion protein
MNLKKFLKARYIIALLIVAGGSFYWYRSYQAKNKPPVYETVPVVLETLKQTVDATGKVESKNDISLRFEMPGTIERMNVAEGSIVKTGQILANIRLAELDAAVAQSQANLNKILAGSTDQDKQYYAAAVESAKASLDQSIADEVNARNTMIVAIQASLPRLDDSLTQADNILGIDNTNANADFKTLLSVQKPSLIGKSSIDYSAAKRARDNARSLALNLISISSTSSVDLVVPAIDTAFVAFNQLLADVSEMLNNTVTNGSFTQAILDGKKTTIESTRITLATQYTSFVGQSQVVTNAKNAISIRRAAYNQALANYQGKVVPPRDVDVAPYRAALAQAVANRDKAIIRAPIDGIITKVNKKIGETVNGSEAIINLLSPHYEVNVDIPETDVAKINVGEKAEITLDAFGEETKFSGLILTIDPGSTEVQDVVYYKVRISLDDTNKAVKPGMTANVSVNAAQKDNVLSIPLRSVKTRTDGTKYVKVLENGQSVEKTVTIGMKANEGKVEILTGLKEGELVILSIK